MQSHILTVHACSACHLHFWQNDEDLLRATAVTRGWNGYRIKSQHRKLTLEKKISPCSCKDSDPQPFSHESGVLTTELSPLQSLKYPSSFFFSVCSRPSNTHLSSSLLIYICFRLLLFLTYLILIVCFCLLDFVLSFYLSLFCSTSLCLLSLSFLQNKINTPTHKINTPTYWTGENLFSLIIRSYFSLC